MKGSAAAFPSPACGRRWPDEVGSDEGSLRFSPDAGASGITPHPTPLRGAAPNQVRGMPFSRKRENEAARA